MQYAPGYFMDFQQKQESPTNFQFINTKYKLIQNRTRKDMQD